MRDLTCQFCGADLVDDDHKLIAADGSEFCDARGADDAPHKVVPPCEQCAEDREEQCGPATHSDRFARWLCVGCLERWDAGDTETGTDKSSAPTVELLEISPGEYDAYRMTDGVGEFIGTITNRGDHYRVLRGTPGTLVAIPRHFSTLREVRKALEVQLIDEVTTTTEA